jgi:hypothetical protein
MIRFKTNMDINFGARGITVNITLQLVGTRNVQEVLSRPSIFECFLSPADEVVRRAHGLVPKQQRERGGNNVYRENILLFVMQMPQQEHAVWVVREFIRPTAYTPSSPGQTGCVCD